MRACEPNTEGDLDVRFEIFVDINLLIKRFLEGFRLSFGGMKGFFFYGEHQDTGLGIRCCRGNEQGKVSGASKILSQKGLGLRTSRTPSV